MTETTAVQDYLKAVYQLGGAADWVPTSALAERLHVTRASVSGMLRRLDEAGLVSHRRYRGVKLTRKGAREAVEMIRHHRLLELYLAEVVGMPWDRVHAEADALEHHISEDLERRLDELLGHPERDPHGHPIPTATLVLEEEALPTLDDAEPGTSWTVQRVSDHSPDLLRHLASMGIRPGIGVRVLEHVPYGGGLRIRIGRDERLIGTEAAEAVSVEGVKR